MDFLQSLKESTRNVHEQIEQLPLFSKIMTHKITLYEYKVLLFALYRYIHPCEEILQQRYPHLISGREKSSLLLSDLSKLNCHHDQSFQFCTEIPCFNNDANVYGYLYVMEGSTLGGQIINKSLTRNPHLQADIASSYFNPYGVQTKKQWQTFTRLLIENNLQIADQANVIKSAISTFTTLINWLSITTQERSE